MEISPTDNLDQPYPLSAQQFFEDCENHRDNLFNFAKRMAGNTLGSEVEDLVQKCNYQGR
jgi:DNA-directed RNA polymerase specialized sigma24 family protein